MEQRKNLNFPQVSDYKKLLIASHKYDLYKQKLGVNKIEIIPIKNITRIEKALYDDKKIYLWYNVSQGKNSRVDIEMSSNSATSDLISRILYISKTIKCKALYIDITL